MASRTTQACPADILDFQTEACKSSMAGSLRGVKGLDRIDMLGILFTFAVQTVSYLATTLPFTLPFCATSTLEKLTLKDCETDTNGALEEYPTNPPGGNPS